MMFYLSICLDFPITNSILSFISNGHIEIILEILFHLFYSNKVVSLYRRVQIPWNPFEL